MQRLKCQEILDDARKLIPFGSYNQGLSDPEADALFKKYCDYLICENESISEIDKSRLKSLIAHHQFYKAIHDAFNSTITMDPVAVIVGYLRAAKTFITYGAANCGVASVVLYFALKRKVFPLDYVLISEFQQIIVVGRSNAKDKLSFREIKKLDDSVLGICAYSDYVFQMNKLFQDEKHLAFCHPDAIKRVQPLTEGVGLGDSEYVFRSRFFIDRGMKPEVVPTVAAIMREIGDIPEMTQEKRDVEKFYSFLTVSPASSHFALFKKSIRDKLVATFERMVITKPRLSTILALVKDKQYGKALRTAANDKSDGLSAAEELLTYKKALDLNLDEQAGAKRQAAVHYAILKENWEVVRLLVNNDASMSLEDADGLSVDKSRFRELSMRQSGK